MVISIPNKVSMLVIPALALGVAFYRYIICQPRTWAEGTTGHLIGETYVRTEREAFDLAASFVQEGYDIWDEPSSNWMVMHNSSISSGVRTSGNDGSSSSSLLVEARRITEGPMAKSNILLARSSGFVAGANADEVYNYFISPSGMQLLDPSMDPDKVQQYIERYNWKGGGKGAHLDIHESFNPMPPGVADRYLVVLNGYRTKDRFFFCKSIVHDSRSGSSVHYDGPKTKNQTVDPRVRAVNTFYFHISPVDDGRGKGSLVRMVNFADFAIGSTMMNWLIPVGFFPGVYQRLEEKFGSEQS